MRKSRLPGGSGLFAGIAKSLFRNVSQMRSRLSAIYQALPAQPSTSTSL